METHRRTLYYTIGALEVEEEEDYTCASVNILRES